MVCLAGIESASPTEHAPVHDVEALTTSSSHLPAGEPQRRVRQQRAREQPGLAQHLEAVADPQHEPAAGREALDLAHHGREAGDRADPQVVPVGEPAGDDHRIDAAEVRVAVPEQLGVADEAGGQKRIDLVTRARKPDDPELHWIS